MTVTDVKDGVVAAVAGKFPDVPVYDDTVPQGMILPCFSVTVIHAAREDHAQTRRQTAVTAVVQYIPEEGFDARDTLYEIGETLDGVLALIDTADGKLHGDERQFDVSAETLNFTARYVYHTFPPNTEAPDPTPTEKMDTMSLNLMRAEASGDRL